MKVISGGQTGADKAGLLAARACGLETGGWAPRGYRTEKGHDDTLKGFGLLERQTCGYEDRTRANIQDADATLILSKRFNSPGTKLTEKICKGLHKPYLLISPFDYDTSKRIVEFLKKHNPQVLNIAGNRESIHPGIQGWCHHLLKEVFTCLKDK